MKQTLKMLVLGGGLATALLGCKAQTDENAASTEAGPNAQTSTDQPAPGTSGGNVGVVSPGAGPSSPVTNSEAVEGGGGGGLYNKAKEQARGVADKAGQQQSEGNEALDK